MIPLRGFDGHKSGFKTFVAAIISGICRPSFERLVQRYSMLHQTILDSEFVQGSWEMHCPACRLDFTTGRWESGSCPRCGNGFTFDERCTEDYSDCWQETEWEHHS